MLCGRQDVTDMQQFQRNLENPQDHAGINLFEKRRVDAKVFGHNVETEEVAVDPGASHGQAVHVLMLVGSSPKQGQPLCVLITNTHGGEGVSGPCLC